MHDRSRIVRCVTLSLLATALAVMPAPAAASPAAALSPLFFKASHAVRGVVTLVDGTTLTIARHGHKKAMVFVLEPETVREGTLDIGAMVSIRYRKDGDVLVATAVEAQPLQPTVPARRKS